MEKGVGLLVWAAKGFDFLLCLLRTNRNSTIRKLSCTSSIRQMASNRYYKSNAGTLSTKFRLETRQIANKHYFWSGCPNDFWPRQERLNERKSQMRDEANAGCLPMEPDWAGGFAQALGTVCKQWVKRLEPISEIIDRELCVNAHQPQWSLIIP